MNFRSVANLSECISKNLNRVSRDIDLIVGIPRSGMLAASLLALYLEKPLTDLDGFIEKRTYSSGRTRQSLVGSVDYNRLRKVLILDDSVLSGKTITRVKERLATLQEGPEIIYAAIYADPKSIEMVDLCFEICPSPRLFEWNVMHNASLQNACLDIDGVLCRDPSRAENDDGPAYEKFLRNAEPLFLPKTPVGFLVTCRLEKYRPQTERWLAEHGVEYQKLIMMDLPSKEARLRAGTHAQFKAQVYRQTGAWLFIESALAQAREIALRTGRKVLCLETWSMMPTGISGLRTWRDVIHLAHRFSSRIWPKLSAKYVFRKIDSQSGSEYLRSDQK